MNVAVVGAGIVGLSTAYALTEQGAACTVYESGPPGNGQSTGRSRIFRHAHDDVRLVELARESRAVWRRWEHDLGVELVSADGGVTLGPAVEDRLKVLAQVPGLPVRPIDAAELADRLPLLAGYDGPAMLDEGGGAIRTRSAIDRLAARVRAHLVTDHVMAVCPTGNGTVEVRTGTGRAEHSHAVVCAGAGTAALARGTGLSLPVIRSASTRVTLPVRGEPPHRVATLQDGSGAFGETGVYASAYPGNRYYTVGIADPVAVHEDGGVADPGELAGLDDRVLAYVERALPGLEPRITDVVNCWVTSLPWSEDGIAVWQADGVSLLAGHNLFKHAPALGRALAAVALGGELRADLRPEARLGSTER